MTGDGMKSNNIIDCPRCAMNYDRGFKEGRNELLKTIVKQEQCKTQVVMAAPAVNVVDWPPYQKCDDCDKPYTLCPCGTINKTIDACKRSVAKAQTVDVGKLVEALGEIKRRSNQFLNGEESSHSHAFQMIVRTCEQALESAKGKI